MELSCDSLRLQKSFDAALASTNEEYVTRLEPRAICRGNVHAEAFWVSVYTHDGDGWRPLFDENHDYQIPRLWAVSKGNIVPAKRQFPSNLPAMLARFTVISNCDFPIWVQNQHGAHGLPIAGNPSPAKLVKGESQVFAIPGEGLAGSRFWAKTGCDDTGYNCIIGDQVPDPMGRCPLHGCTPPVDSLFEATWGCTLSDASACAVNPSAPSQRLGRMTYLDTSQVDGYTLPYRVEFHGDTAHCDCDAGGHCKGTASIDASNLRLDDCPSDDDLSEAGRFPEYATTDLRLRVGGEVVACMSPCKRLNAGQPFGVRSLASAGWHVGDGW